MRAPNRPRRLGRLPHDDAQLARAPQLARYLEAMTAPAVIDRSDVPFTPHLDDNDQIGDCTAVALANCARAAAALRGDKQFAISTADVICFYEQSTGYVWGEPQTDRGGVIASVLAYQAAHGFPVDHTKIKGAWGTFDPRDRNLMGVAIDVVGSVDLGVALADADKAMTIWDTNSPASAGDPAPGSWGGHSLMIFAYTGLGDTDLVELGTWGEWQRATWRWIDSRVQEAHAIAWRRFGAMLPGLDFDRLLADSQLFQDA
jgi:hypothetical protein